MPLKKWVSQWDKRTILLLNAKLHCSILDRAIPFITRFGSAQLTITIGFIFIIISGYHKGSAPLLSLGASHLIIRILKAILPRYRPYMECAGIRIFPTQLCDSSFPSGHTTAAFSIATSLAYAFPAYSTLLFLGAFLVGYSRIYLGLHYPSDVLIGAAIGFLSSLMVGGLLQ
jgi:undecaprenyl-diphosphatase